MSNRTTGYYKVQRMHKEVEIGYFDADDGVWSFAGDAEKYNADPLRVYNKLHLVGDAPSSFKFASPDVGGSDQIINDCRNVIFDANTSTYIVTRNDNTVFVVKLKGDGVVQVGPDVRFDTLESRP